LSQLSFSQIEQLWVSNGGSQMLAPIMAAIAMAESGGNTDALNNNPSTGDYSVGLWQINYYSNLLGPRTQKYGSPSNLQSDPNLQAKAAIDLAGNGSGLGNWTTYTSGKYRAYLQGANVPVPSSSPSSGSGIGASATQAQLVSSPLQSGITGAIDTALPWFGILNIDSQSWVKDFYSAFTEGQSIGFIFLRGMEILAGGFLFAAGLTLLGLTLIKPITQPTMNVAEDALGVDLGVSGIRKALKPAKQKAPDPVKEAVAGSASDGGPRTVKGTRSLFRGKGPFHNEDSDFYQAVVDRDKADKAYQQHRREFRQGREI
jgi:hypothetical protein